MSTPLPMGAGTARRAASALRRLGWKRFIARGYRRAASFLVRRNRDIVLRKDLDEQGDASLGMLLQTRAFEGGDAAILDRLPAAWRADRRRIALLRAYVESGYRALFAELDGTIVGHMWWTEAGRAHPHLLRYDVRLGPRDAWAFNFVLEPRYRGGGNANEFLAKFEEHLRSRGFRHVWGVVASDNKPARWLYSLCGWRARKAIDSVEIAGGLLFCRTGIFLRNSRRRKHEAHDYRRIA